MSTSTEQQELERRIREAVREERAACIRIVEECYSQLSHGHGANADTMAREILRRLEARGTAGG